MKFLRGHQVRFHRVRALGSMLILLLVVGCGTAATATPPPPTAKPASPQAGGVPTAASAPTVVPGPTAAVVSQGKVTWLVGSFGNERFDYTFSAGGGHDYARQMHAFLISSDEQNGNRVIVPGVATNWEISDDGLSWTLTVRKGVKFHNGTEVTVDDVLWTLRHTMGPEAKAYASSNGSLTLAAIMDRIEAVGPDKVSIRTKIPASDLPGTISEAGGTWIATPFPKRQTIHDATDEAAYDRNPIGAGIMKLVKHIPADSMTFERFEDYYYQPKNGLPKDRRVTFSTLDLRLVSEEATRVAALRAGEADIAPVSIASKKQVEAGGGRVVFGQEGSYFYGRHLGCWKEQFPCHDKRVRQALNYAVDKETMRDRLYGGPEIMQVKGWGFVTPSTIGYSSELDPYSFNPNKARQLLAEAGYPGGQGFGKLIINTWSSASVPLMPEAAQLAASSWKRELGLDVEVKVGDEAALKKDTRLSENYYGQILFRDNETRVDGGSNLRSSFGTPDAIDRAHNDPELFRLVQESLGIFEPGARAKALNNAFLRMRDEGNFITVGYINIPWGVGPRVRTWQPYPLAFYPSALHTITIK